MRISPVLLVSILTVGCGAESLDAPPVTPATHSPATSGDRVVMTVNPAGETAPERPAVPAEPAAPAGAASMQRTAPSQIVVLQTTKLDHYAEVVGPIDMHEAMGDERIALQKLRERASEMGADAVIGVEFHHGEGEGEPTHLSGLAVRYVDPPSLPIHHSISGRRGTARPG